MIKKFRILAAAGLLLALTAALTMADWVTDDGHKMHFPQYPDSIGWDVNATNPTVLADDWRCTESGWVKDIHFWGSWMHGDEGQIISFNLSIHEDIPANPPEIPFSRPGITLWEREVTNFIIAPPVDPPGWQGWYDPNSGQFFEMDHQAYFQYNVFLDSLDWFWQDAGNIYWLNISATVLNPAATQWGWKSTQDHFMDDAVWADWQELNWNDLWEPPDFMQSLDLSFVITGGEEPIGACCYPDPAGDLSQCIETTIDDCINNLNGVYQGDGTACAGMEACCLPSGLCIDADALCCVTELGGIPQGSGTQCTQPEACCLPDGSCIDVDPLCCDDIGGIPQGPGTACSAATIACCFTDGSCLDVDPLCCDDLGGTPSPTGAPACLGDSDLNGIDDACETPTGACCWIDGTCTVETESDCVNNGGIYKGDGTVCLGDNNGNGIDDICETWEPGDGHKMHFPQLPDELGWDVNATQPLVLADDWQCSETGWVMDIHFWGSWEYGNTGQINSFVLSIHADIPADPPIIPYSRPGETLWEHEITNFGAVPKDPPSMEGWYDPSTGMFRADDHQAYFQYDVFLPESLWFWQTAGTIYWLNISAILEDPVNTQWGWKSSKDHWQDDAVWSFWGPPLVWTDMYEPPLFDTSLDLAFVITSGAPTGACCYPAATFNGWACVETTPDDCINTYGGIYEGDGTTCQGIEACCLPDGSCILADALCCVNELGGIPQGPGTQCTQPEACCLPDGSCIDVDPLCCDDIGGIPQGPGTACSAATIACCFTDGSCLDVDPLCCDDLGGTPSPTGAPFCLGDTDGNGVDDACEEIKGACCWPDGTCTLEKETDCVTNGGDYKGDGTNCLGDINNDGIDDICQNLWPGHKMHYPQLPDEAGWDVYATSGSNLAVNLADDWRCSETGWVKDLHWWGSWKNGSQAPILAFGIRIWNDIPASESPTGYSMPGDILWEKALNPTIQPIDPPTLEGWYNPATEEVLPNNHQEYFRYDLMLDSLDWFWQEEGTIYWLSIICVHLGSADQEWGWKSSKYHFMDDAVWGLEGEYNWIDIWEPPDFDTSLDLAFVITSGVEPTGACCYPATTFAGWLCVETTADDCINTYGGIYEGDGTTCQGMEACCLPDGSCMNADALCCVNELGGTPQGPGTQCSAVQACCLPDGTCQDLDSLCCLDLGGTPQGTGTQCSGTTIACCLTDGSCMDVDPLCCDDFGGIPSPYGAPACMGDANGNGVDDACEEITGACCWTDGTCTMETNADCVNNGGDYKGDGTHCLGDHNNDGIDDICQNLWPGHKMHYPQLPDEAGWDVLATALPNYAVNLADDWRCSETGWVKDLHWWGSWKNGIQATVLGYAVRIYDDIPASVSPTGYSMPGELLWEKFFSPAGTAITPPTPEGWYDPYTGLVIPNDHQEYFRYDVMLDSLDWFWQEEGTIYWLSIICVPLTTGEWGWKSSVHHFNDDAVWGLEGEWNWIDLWEPPDFEVSLDLAFVITSGVEPIGACCYPDTSGIIRLCVEVTEDSCNALGGVYQGDGTVCANDLQACCLPDGECRYADVYCCVNHLGGTPQGPGTSCGDVQACCLPDGACQELDTLCCYQLGGVPQGVGSQCTQPEACCLADGSCIMVDPICCDEMGGTPQGLGTACSPTTIACCLTDGSCMDVDPLCCDDMGGTPSPIGAPACLGDNNGNSIDDACEEPTGACCWTDGSCTVEEETDCIDNGGDYKGDGTTCLGDINGNGVDDICEELWPGHKMHYPQLPDEAGWDVYATAIYDLPVNLADDWRCSETGWVKDIHFWGSWKGGNQAPILFFGIRIWSDIPASHSPTGYSMPGEILWEKALSPDAQGIDPPTPEGWYNPATNEVIFNDHQEYFRYDLILDSLDWFWQEEGNVYWLSIICSHLGSETYQWGWKSSKYHFLDDAVWGLEGEWNWIDIWEPPDFDTSLDLAFVITSGFVCDCIPGDANGDGALNVADAVYIINYVFKNGPPPTPYRICSGDANCDCMVNVADAVYLINYVFKNGPPPCACTGPLPPWWVNGWLEICGPPLRQ